MKAVVAKQLVILIALLLVSSAVAREKRVDKGLRFGAGLLSVVSDSEKDIYPSNWGLGWDLSYDMVFKLAGNFRLHAAAGFDYRFFYEYFDSRVVCGALVEENGHVHSVCKDQEYDGYSGVQFLYLEHPLMLQWRTSERFFVEAGAVLDLKLVFKYEFDFEEDADAFEHLPKETIGFGLMAGVGRMFNSGFSVDLRIAYQLTDLVSANKYKKVETFVYTETDEKGNTYPVRDYEVKPFGSYFNLFRVQLGAGYWF